MRVGNFGRCAAALVLAAAMSFFAIVVQPSPASAENGGCPNQPHNVHTSDTSPYRAWACFIDNGDKIRVCDNAVDGVHAHADLWSDIGAWLQVAAEDDGEDAGCDEASAGNLTGYLRLRLRVCAQRADQSNFACNEVIWYETD